jgi:hypothetical protein
MNILKFKIKYYILVAIFFTSCQKELKMPVEQNKMVQILADIHFAESSLDNEVQGVKDSMGRKYYNQIFAKYQVSRLDFDSSMGILTNNPENINTLYLKVIDELKKRAKDSTGVKTN